MKVNKERKVCIGSKYKHFKGHLVRVLCIASHTETEEDLVVYRNEETNKIYARPLNMFISEVDKEKYPNATQKYRFEKV